MRLTYKFSTAGASGMAKMPMLRHDGEWYLGPDNMLDDAKVRTELRDHSQVMFSSDDDRTVITFAVEFMDRVKLSWQRRMEDKTSGLTEVANKPSGTPLTTAEKRMENDRVCYVRVDIGSVTGAIRVKLSVGNPRNTVGHSEEMAGYVAQTFADTLTAIRDDLNGIGGGVVFVEGDGCEGMFAKSVERNRLAFLREKLWDCPNRINGYCSPCKPECEFCKNGRCEWR